jgi:acyl-CoA thioesterase-1
MRGILTFAFVWSAGLAAPAAEPADVKPKPADGPRSKLAANLKAGKKQTVVACGTSLTASGNWVKPFGAALEKAHPGLTTIVNTGVSGSCSQWLVKNLDDAVLKRKPDTVIIEYGINDCVPRFNYGTDELRKNLDAIVKRIRDELPNCEIVLMTMTPGNGPPEGHASYRKNIGDYYQVYRDVAKAHGFLLVDTYPTWKKLMETDKALYRKYCPDTIHESEEGGRAVIVPAVLKTLGIEAKQDDPAGQPDRDHPKGANQ